MDRPRLIRGLRIAWSVGWGILCVLLVVLWVRSYGRWETAWWCKPPLVIGVDSMFGMLAIEIVDDYLSDSGESWGINSTLVGVGVVDGFYSNPHGRYFFVIPYWLSVLITAFFAAATWPLWRWKFSLRALLIATTLIAVVLGTAVYLLL